ncbi:hypothetical protein KEM52_002847 [Ascosphaera acerosa]|nr:hypothetical protein KEM52_002847 [Ascosphaera acerosa]
MLHPAPEALSQDQVLAEIREGVQSLYGVIQGLTHRVETLEQLSQGSAYQPGRHGSRAHPEQMAPENEMPEAPAERPRSETAAPNPTEIDRERYRKWDAKKVGIFFPNAPRAWGESGRFYHNGIRYYRDVATFAWDVRAYTRRNPRSSLVEHIEDLMEGNAHDWYARTVPEGRRLRYYGTLDGVERWLQDLEQKFKLNPVEARRRLERLAYGPKQVGQGIAVDTYVAAARSALLATDPHVSDDAVVAAAWNQLALEYKAQVPLPPLGTTTETFVDMVDRRRIVWEDQLRDSFPSRRPEQRPPTTGPPQVRRAQLATEGSGEEETNANETQEVAYAATPGVEDSLRVLAEKLGKALDRLGASAARKKGRSADGTARTQPGGGKDFYTRRNEQLDARLLSRAPPPQANNAGAEEGEADKGDEEQDTKSAAFS